MDMLLGWGRQKCADFGERTKFRLIQTLILRSGVAVLEEGILLRPARRNVVLGSSGLGVVTFAVLALHDRCINTYEFASSILAKHHTGMNDLGRI